MVDVEVEDLMAVEAQQVVLQTAASQQVLAPAALWLGSQDAKLH